MRQASHSPIFSLYLLCFNVCRIVNLRNFRIRPNFRRLPIYGSTNSIRRTPRRRNEIRLSVCIRHVRNLRNILCLPFFLLLSFWNLWNFSPIQIIKCYFVMIYVKYGNDIITLFGQIVNSFFEILRSIAFRSE